MCIGFYTEQQILYLIQKVGVKASATYSLTNRKEWNAY